MRDVWLRGEGERFWWDLGIFSPGPPQSISPIWEEKIGKEKDIEKIPKLSPSLHVNVFFFFIFYYLFFLFLILNVGIFPPIFSMCLFNQKVGFVLFCFNQWWLFLFIYF